MGSQGADSAMQLSRPVISLRERLRAPPVGGRRLNKGGAEGKLSCSTVPTKVSAGPLAALKLGWPFQAVSGLPKSARPLGSYSDQPQDKGCPGRTYGPGEGCILGR